MLTFLTWTTLRAPAPFHLCADLRRHVHSFLAQDATVCQRCGTVVVDDKRVRVCMCGDGVRLCFLCYHRNRWPR